MLFTDGLKGDFIECRAVQHRPAAAILIYFSKLPALQAFQESAVGVFFQG
jgi:hypothetical protein